MRAVLAVLSPGTALSFRIAGSPATLKVSVVKVPVVGTADARRDTKRRYRNNMLEVGLASQVRLVSRLLNVDVLRHFICKYFLEI